MKEKIRTSYKYFVGVDISKDTLDCALLQGSKPLLYERISNQQADIRRFVEQLLSLEGLTKRNCVFGMENTGIYGNPIIQLLGKLKIKYVVEHGLHVQRSLGVIRGKSDKMDAERIALHLYKSRDLLTLTVARRPVIDQLATLSTLRERLAKLELKLSVPLKESIGYVSKELSQTTSGLCAATIAAVHNDLSSVEALIKATWKADEETARLMELMLSVPSVGPVTALQVLITTNEFKNISEVKKFACYAGIAPFPYQSGSSIDHGTRISKIANKKMKSLIRICAINASRNVPDIKAYYIRKQVEGKHKLSVLNAIAFKVISRVFVCVKKNRMYIRDYDPSAEKNKQLDLNKIHN